MISKSKMFSYLFICLLIIASSLWLFANKQNYYKSDNVNYFPAPISEVEEQLDKFNEEPTEREKWFTFQRSYPFNDIPLEARNKAWEFVLKEQSNFLDNQSSSDPSWQLIGPAPTDSAVPNNWGVTSGRINAVALSPLDPQIVLVGASTGGVWRSSDGGKTFTPVTDNQVDLAVSSIAFSKSNPSIVYSGMGDINGGYLGTGVLKSTDAGQTWVKINDKSLPEPALVARIEVAPDNPDRVYLAQFARLSTGRLFSSGFYLSTNGGVSWTRTLPGLPTDLSIDPVNPNILYQATIRVDQMGNPPAGIYRSTDGGNTWTNMFVSPYVANGTFDIRVAQTPANPRLIYIYTGGVTSSNFDVRIIKSTDSGATWTNLSSMGIDTNQFGYNTYISIDPTDESTLYIGSRDIFKSTNGGSSWRNLNSNFTSGNAFQPSRSNTHPDQHALAFSPTDPKVIYVGNDGGLSKSTDGGNTYVSLNSTLALTQSYGLTLHPTNPSISYVGTQDNGIQMRQGGSNVWKEFFTGDYGNVVLNPRDPSTGFCNFVFGTIFRFRNGNRIERQVARNSTFGESDSRPRIAFLAPLTGNGVNDTIYFGTFRLFTSTDLGGTWASPAPDKDLTKGVTQQGADVLSVISVARSNTSVIYTGSAQGRAMTSTDGGLNWRDITTGLPNRFISSIILDDTNPAIAYLSVSGFGSGHVFKTTNSGSTWDDISGNLPDIACNDLIIDPKTPNTLYAGTDIGVFRSTIDGKTWEVFNNGLPPVVVMDFDSQKSTGLLQLATYGRSVYELKSGATADFSLAFDPSQVNVARKQSGQFTLNIRRMEGFTGNVTVTFSDTKALKIKLTPASQSTTNSTLNFNFKVKGAATPGSKQIVFTGRDDSGRTRSATLTLVVQ
ncbi:MAG: hypothetical protein HY819_02070 [Acidobacteria bacterium]|nr:hypothetical protein [Acidobacteriota bacterium]